jgi:hypothetical protein
MKIMSDVDIVVQLRFEAETRASVVEVMRAGAWKRVLNHAAI